MQRDIASAWDLAFAVCCAVGWPPFGRSDLHVFIADLNAGPFTWTPFTDVLSGVCWTRRLSWPPLGSGKLGTPCERMHRANFNPCALLTAAFFAPVDAALSELELDEPQPATAMPAPARQSSIAYRTVTS